MAIKDKDGNVYRLRGPNPLVKEMSEWDKSQVKLINIGSSKVEVIEDERNPVKASHELVIDIGEELNLDKQTHKSKNIRAKDFLKEISEPVQEQEKIAEKPQEIVEPEPSEETFEPEPVIINVDQKLSRIIKERGVEFFCVPVVGTIEHRDELYGNSYYTNKYGDKFIFDAVIIDSDDFQIQFWCIKQVSKDSVVFRRNPEGAERWWRIHSIEPKTGGFLCLATISDVNPDFS